MFSVIIPTMWYGVDIHTMVPALEACPVVGEIIIINNNSDLLWSRHHGSQTKSPGANLPSWYTDNSISKLVKIEPNTNIYVSPAFNAGVEASKHDQLLLLQDDMSIDANALPLIAPHITADKGIVGGNGQAKPYPTPLPTLPTEAHIPTVESSGGWHPATMYLHKDNYNTIPPELPIHYGETWLCMWSIKIGKQPRMLKNIEHYYRHEGNTTTRAVANPITQLNPEWIRGKLGISAPW